MECISILYLQTLGTAKQNEIRTSDMVSIGNGRVRDKAAAAGPFRKSGCASGARTAALSVGWITATLLLGFSPLGAASVDRINLFEMVRVADRIFWGRCLQSEPGREPATGLPVTTYVFQVLRGIKGASAGESIRFRQLRGGATGSLRGLPEYPRGQDILLFLYPDSRLGLTSPVGLVQGVFQVGKGGRRGPAVMNRVGNANLLHRVNSGQMHGSTLSSEEQAALRPGAPVSLDRFESVVRRIDRYWAKQEPTSR